MPKVSDESCGLLVLVNMLFLTANYLKKRMIFFLPQLGKSLLEISNISITIRIY